MTKYFRTRAIRKGSTGRKTLAEVEAGIKGSHPRSYTEEFAVVSEL